MDAFVEGDDLEADLGSLSDEDWRDAHDKLFDSGIPEEELFHVWDPDLEGDDLIPPEERVHG